MTVLSEYGAQRIRLILQEVDIGRVLDVRRARDQAARHGKTRRPGAAILAAFAKDSASMMWPASWPRSEVSKGGGRK